MVPLLFECGGWSSIALLDIETDSTFRASDNQVRIDHES